MMSQVHSCEKSRITRLEYNLKFKLQYETWEYICICIICIVHRYMYVGFYTYRNYANFMHYKQNQIYSCFNTTMLNHLVHASIDAIHTESEQVHTDRMHILAKLWCIARMTKKKKDQNIYNDINDFSDFRHFSTCCIATRYWNGCTFHKFKTS